MKCNVLLMIMGLMVVPALHALEASAGSMGDQTKLHSIEMKSQGQIMALEAVITEMDSKINSMTTCANQDMIYKPATESCITPSLPNCPNNAMLKRSGGSWKCATEYTKICGDGGTVYCNGSDTRDTCLDTGSGSNHGVTLVGTNGCRAWEGSGNGGTSDCLLSCTNYQ